MYVPDGGRGVVLLIMSEQAAEKRDYRERGNSSLACPASMARPTDI